jgi:hypothetical protein
MFQLEVVHPGLLLREWGPAEAATWNNANIWLEIREDMFSVAQWLAPD